MCHQHTTPPYLWLFCSISRTKQHKIDSSSFQSQIPQTWFVHLFRMSTKLRLKLVLLPWIAVLLFATRTVAAGNGGNPSGSSVNIINGLNDTFFLHCSSKENDFDQVAVLPKTNYYWKFDPNIFGRTVYNCEFLWAKKRQEFPVWQGNEYHERPHCCARGPCKYKVCPDGIYNAVTTDTDDDNVAEEWTLYQTWLVAA